MDYKVLVAAPLTALLVVAYASELKLPSRWSAFSSASRDTAYTMGRDAQVQFEGRPSLTIRSNGRVGDTDHGGSMQYLATSGYEGKRVRFSGKLKASGLTVWAGAWVKAGEQALRNFDGATGGPAASLPFADGIGPGHTDWRPVSVVIEVGEAPAVLSMGVALVGEGQVWMSDLRFEEVGTDVPLTTARVGLDADKRRQLRAHAAPPTSSGSRGMPANLALDP